MFDQNIPSQRDQTKQLGSGLKKKVAILRLQHKENYQDLIYTCTLSSRNCAPTEYHPSLTTPTLDNWFKPSNTSKKGFKGISEVVDLTTDDAGTASDAMDM